MYLTGIKASLAHNFKQQSTSSFDTQNARQHRFYHQKVKPKSSCTRLCHSNKTQLCKLLICLLFFLNSLPGKGSWNCFINNAMNIQHIDDAQFMKTVLLHKPKSTYNTHTLHRVLIGFRTGATQGFHYYWRINSLKYTPNSLCLWFFASAWENDFVNELY